MSIADEELGDYAKTVEYLAFYWPSIVGKVFKSYEEGNVVGDMFTTMHQRKRLWTPVPYGPAASLTGAASAIRNLEKNGDIVAYSHPFSREEDGTFYPDNKGNFMFIRPSDRFLWRIAEIESTRLNGADPLSAQEFVRKTRGLRYEGP